MRLALMVAVAENGVIGLGGALPWHLPADLKWFRARTMGHHVIMGRRTHESIGRPLPGRTNVVVTRNPEYRAEGCEVVDSLQAALQRAEAAGDAQPVVIGGAELYREAMPRADLIYLTRVLASVPGDVHLPPLDERQWLEVSREPHPADERHEFPFAFCVLQRRDQSLR